METTGPTRLPTARDPGGTVVAGRYEVVRTLGAGAFGRTFLARDRDADRPVALKLFDPRAADDWKAHELFAREAAVLRALRHPAIPEVHDLVRDAWDGVPASFLVMEYVEGASLREVIDERRPLAPAAVVEAFVELLGILDYLHGRVPPVLHRDIKPANVLLRPDGRVALVDFGSVRAAYPGTDAGSTIAGTYGYMPYEQYMGQATPSSDLYALGATFLHLLTGRPPRDFMSDEGRIAVPPPERLAGDPRLAQVLARLLRPSPAERFASAREARLALLGATVDATPAAVPPPDPGGRTDVVRAVDAAHAVAPRRGRAITSAVPLPPAPRTLDGDTLAALDRAAPRAWELMDGAHRRGDRASTLDVATFVLFSVLTVGIMPAVFVAVARARRRRLRRFFAHGESTLAEILRIDVETTAFAEKISRVTYEFDADGAPRRGSDQVVGSIAHRWQPGDRVQVLYLPAEGYDSVIVSTE